MSVFKVSAPVLLASAFLVCFLVTGCGPGAGAVSSPVAKRPQATAPSLDSNPSRSASEPAAQTAAPSRALATPASPPAPKIDTQRDQALISSVEKAYQTGLSNYHAGHLQAARSSFDYAVDQMLTSGLDIKNDPALSAEFDHIVAAVNTLEMDALREGGSLGAAQAPAEPAPVEVANSVTFPVDAKVKAQAQAELKTTRSDLPLVINDYVASYINFFSNTTKGHNTIVNALTRAGRYKDMIQRILKQQGVPQDLVYQAVAESGFRPQAVNPHSGAGGMWQFMPYGDYGLARNGWYDERFDPEKATEAYAREMKKAYAQLGDWYLAMAAYDWGTGNVQRAVERTGYVDFWQLYKRNNLPQETKNYVPIILAVAIMAKNPKQYGLANLTPDPPLVTDTVTTNYAVNLRLVADVTNVPLEEIVSINPSLLRMSTPPDEPFDLHLPVGTKDLFEKRIAEIPENKRRLWRFHVVAPGDTLSSIARTFHVSASQIAFVNQMDSSSDLSGVEGLVIPVAPASAPRLARSERYRTRRGDTLVTVADRFDVTVEQLRRWNHLSSSEIKAGRRLYISEPAHVSRRRWGRHRSHSRSQKTASAAHREARTSHVVRSSSSRKETAKSPRKKKKHLDAKR